MLSVREGTGIPLYVCHVMWSDIASYPVSTANLFFLHVGKFFFQHAKVELAVETGNEASQTLSTS